MKKLAFLLVCALAFGIVGTVLQDLYGYGFGKPHIYMTETFCTASSGDTRLSGVFDPPLPLPASQYNIVVQTLQANGTSYVYIGPIQWSGVGSGIGDWNLTVPASMGFSPGDGATATVYKNGSPIYGEVVTATYTTACNCLN